MRNLPPIDTGEPHAQIPKFGAVEMCLIGASLQQQPCDLQRENLDLEMHACVFITMRHTRKTTKQTHRTNPIQALELLHEEESKCTFLYHKEKNPSIEIKHAISRKCGINPCNSIAGTCRRCTLGALFTGSASAHRRDNVLAGIGLGWTSLCYAWIWIFWILNLADVGRAQDWMEAAWKLVSPEAQTQMCRPLGKQRVQ